MLSWLRTGLLTTCCLLPRLAPLRAEPPTAKAAGAADSAAPLLDAQVVDLDDRPVSLRGLRGKVLVLLHQDRKSSDQHASFKDGLGQLAGRYPERLTVVALADVGGFNFWPARRYVKDALRPLRNEGGALVLCDWHGAIRKRYDLSSGQSAVFVVSRDGQLRLLKRGLFTADEAAQALALIQQLAGAAAGSND